jgi:hypothetical protein
MLPDNPFSVDGCSSIGDMPSVKASAELRWGRDRGDRYTILGKGRASGHAGFGAE